MLRQVVVARYKEDITWVGRCPHPVLVYNKGRELNDACGAECVSLPNIGRETHTYLEHILTRWDRLADYTVFTQGDPFEHSPDFLQLLNGPLEGTQPLSWRWKAWDDVFHVGPIPPEQLLLSRSGSQAGAGRVYVEFLNHSFEPVLPKYYFDFGRSLFLRKCRKMLKIQKDETLGDYYWKRIFGDSRTIPLLIPFCFAGIFGAPKEAIRARGKTFYEDCMKLLLEHNVHGYIFERLWLCIFGYQASEADQFYFPKESSGVFRKIPADVKARWRLHDPGFWRFCFFGIWWFLVRASLGFAWRHVRKSFRARNTA